MDRAFALQRSHFSALKLHFDGPGFETAISISIISSCWHSVLASALLRGFDLSIAHSKVISMVLSTEYVVYLHYG